MPSGRIVRAARAPGSGAAAAFLLLVTLLVSPPGSAVASEPWEFSIFALTDTRGELRPCRCPGLDSGGLGLRATVFKKARGLQVPALILDGGDFVSGPEDSLQAARAELFVSGMERLPYDAVAVGEAELSLGPAFLRDAAARLPLVCANLEGAEELGIPRVRRVARDGRVVLVTAYLDPGLLAGNGEWRVGDPASGVASALASQGGDVADVVIVLAHATTAAAEETVAGIPGIGVAVRGHAPEGGPPLGTAGSVPVLLPSAAGLEVIQATFHRLENGTLERRGLRSWEIKQVEKGDARLDALVEAFEAAHGLTP